MNKLSNTVYLRLPEEKDVEQILNWENDSRIWHLSGTDRAYTIDNIKDLILNLKKGILEVGQARYLICTQENLTVGCLDLFNYDSLNSRAGVGVLIDKNYRSRSYAKKALALLIELCFNTLQIHHLYAHIQLENLMSIKLFEGQKFEKKSILKEWNIDGNKYTDVALYELNHVKK